MADQRSSAVVSFTIVDVPIISRKGTKNSSPHCHLLESRLAIFPPRINTEERFDQSSSQQVQLLSYNRQQLWS